VDFERVECPKCGEKFQPAGAAKGNREKGMTLVGVIPFSDWGIVIDPV
jgi:hypothetical protein